MWTAEGKRHGIEVWPQVRAGRRRAGSINTRFVRTVASILLAGLCLTCPQTLFAQQPLTEDFTLQPSPVRHNGFFGRDVAISGQYALVSGSDGGASSDYVSVYHIVGNAWTHQAQLFCPDAGSGTYNFGVCAAISGDYAIVGANYADVADDNAGAAYVYHRDGETWSYMTALTASGAAAQDQFGISAAIEGDYAVIGTVVPNDQTGAAYVYHLQDGVWTQQARLTASDGETGDKFGISVAISGNSIVVGAAWNNAAYVFQRDGETWQQQAELTADDTKSRAFGVDVAIDGDYLVVGANGDDVVNSDTGSAFVFHRNGDTWELDEKLVASDRGYQDRLGSVDISGDYIVLGAAYADDGATDTGKAYLFRRDQDGWTELTRLAPSDPCQQDYFGDHVAVDGNWALIGSPSADSSFEDTGAAYVYTIPEPATFALVALGGLGLLRRRCQRPIA